MQRVATENNSVMEIRIDAESETVAYLLHRDADEMQM